MLRQEILLIYCVIWTCAFAVSCTEQEGAGTTQKKISIPLVECRRAAGNIRIDGRLDEPAWRKADSLKVSFLLEPKDAENRSATTARFLWDDKYLYVAFECEDCDIWSYSNKSDDQLWRGDVAELFVKPSTSTRAYYEFVIAPNGAMYDARYPSRGAGGYWRFKGWSSKANVATAINGTDGDVGDDDRGYIVEMAIPLAAFTDAEKPADGVIWTVGAFRYDYSKLFETPMLLMSIPESKRGFHYYEGYNQLIFRDSNGSSGQAFPEPTFLAGQFSLADRYRCP
jgi:hypothetical protein